MHRHEKVSAEKVARCEARAQRIVETLLDPVPDVTEFLSQFCGSKAEGLYSKFGDEKILTVVNLRWINPDHYQSITEERAIQKTCGYPLCEEILVNIPTKKYQICSNTNKVYDLTNRKNFCSNQCYKASCYLKQQLLASPLWIREKEEIPKFNVLKNSTELMGEEVSFGIEKVSLSESLTDLRETDGSKMMESKPDPNHCIADISTSCSTSIKTAEHNPRVASEDSLYDAKSSSTNSTRAEIHSTDNNSIVDVRVSQPTSLNSKICDKSDGDHLPCQQPENLKIANPFAGSTAAENSTQNHSKRNFSKICNRGSDCSRESESKTEFHSSVKDQSITGSSSLVFRVEKSLREWCTVDTFAFIMGVESVKRMMLEKGKNFETKEQAESDAYIYERYAAIFKKLKILELEKEKHTNEIKFEKPTRPLPDFATLKEQTQEMEIKVRAFYRGDKKVTFDENKNQNDENGPSVVLPALHQHARMAIRRNIVLDKLKNILPDLAVMLGLRTIDLNEKIKQLAATCKFEAHNVTFKPVEWNLVGLTFIKLLSLRDTDLQKCLREKANYVNAVLMSYQLESNYLDLVCTWLMDLDQILKYNEEYFEHGN